MTDKPEPISDEELDRLLALRAAGKLTVGDILYADRPGALLARIEAEKARADRAEAALGEAVRALEMLLSGDMDVSGTALILCSDSDDANAMVVEARETLATLQQAEPD